MSESRIRKKGVITENTVEILNEENTVFHGWKSISISKSIETISDTFSIEYDNRFTETNETWPLRPGILVKINIDGDRVLTGRIDGLNSSFSSGSRSTSIAGRSLIGDAVDSSVPPKQYDDIFIDKFAEELLKPFNIKVFLSVTPKKIASSFSTKHGETVFSALDRAARAQGFLWVSTPGGNIRLTEAAKAKSISNIEENFNMISGDISINDSERFNVYKVVGQSSGNDNFSGLSVSAPSATVKDENIRAARTLTIVAESNIDSTQAKTRAGWESSIRLAKSLQVNATVLGWKQEDGSLWGVNQLTRFKSKILGLDTELLITTVELQKVINGGTTSVISLTRKDAYKFQPVVPKEDNSLFPAFAK